MATTPDTPRTYSNRDNAGAWLHDDGTPCPSYWSSTPTAPGGEAWWCTEHQQHVHAATSEPTPPPSDVPDGLTKAEREVLYAPDRRMDAYYYGFEPTGAPEVDAILSAVAHAGKAFHGTESWNEEGDESWPGRWGVGRSCVDVIQAAANECAARLAARDAEWERQIEALAAEWERWARDAVRLRAALAQPAATEPGTAGERAKVITLCGSTRFKSEFESWNSRLTLLGNVVLSVGVFGHGYHPYHREKYLDPAKPMLDRLHLQKIDMADEVFVIDPGGYIGESTTREIEYARKQGKPVRFLSQEDPTCTTCGRDNRNGTHVALERTGHLSHPFTPPTWEPADDHA